MSVAAVAAVAGKTGGVALLVAGVPGTLYVAKDYIFLYEVEREILKSDTKFTSVQANPSPEAGNGETYVTTLSFSTDQKWSCVVSAKKTEDSDSNNSLDATKLKKHLESRLPIAISGENSSVSTGTIDAQTKQLNKDLLFWDCYKTRKVESDGQLISSFVFFAKKAAGDANWTVDLFGKKEIQQEN